jgi:hypothetical protein
MERQVVEFSGYNDRIVKNPQYEKIKRVDFKKLLEN